MSTQIALPLHWASAQGEADFFVSDANREAVRFLTRPGLWPVRAAVLVGPEGSGKSHLAKIFRDSQQGALQLFEDVDQARDEEALFHAWNRASDGGPLLLLTARSAPVLWNVRLPDLASRLAAMVQIAIRAPDDQLLLAVMAKQFRDHGWDVAPAVLSYVVARMERSFAAARDMVEKLDNAAQAAGKAITLPLARSLLAESDAEGDVTQLSSLGGTEG